MEQRIERDAERQRATVLDDPLARQAIEDLGRRVDPYSDPAKVSERRGDHTEHVRLMLDLIKRGFSRLTPNPRANFIRSLGVLMGNICPIGPRSFRGKI